MHQIAGVLNTSIASLFGAENGIDGKPLAIEGAISSPLDKDAIALNGAYLRIKDTNIRKAVIELILSLAKTRA